MGLQSTYYSSSSSSINNNNNNNHQVPPLRRRKLSSIHIYFCHPHHHHHQQQQRRRQQQQQNSKTRLLWIVVIVIIIVVFLYSLLSFTLYTPSSSSESTITTTRYMKFLTSFLSNRRPAGSNTGSSLGVLLVQNNMNTVGIQSDGTTTTTTTTATPVSPVSPVSLLPLQKVLTTALWSYFAGDALSAPTHWYYGGYTQIQQYYGNHGIMTYTKPSMILHGSILNKSNLNGGGRSTIVTSMTRNDASSSSTSSSSSSKTIIGHVINHGKQDLWDPKKSIHYHATLEAGENTLEVSIARVLMKSIVDNHGQFNIDHFRQAYITFMTTPGSHNDTYASTCHRMFFANMYHKHINPIDCPDNDHHNVDTIDGLVLPTITAMVVAGQPYGTIEQASQQAAATVSVTRNSPTLQRYASTWGALVFQTIRTVAAATATATVTAAAAAAAPYTDATTTMTSTSTTTTTTTVLHLIKDMALTLQLRTPQIRSQDEITACYLDSAVPAMLDTMIKYMPITTMNTNTNTNTNTATASKRKQQQPMTVWDGLLRNANIGGENVHRGSCLGAIWGAVAASTTINTDDMNTNTNTNYEGISLPSQLVNGLYHQKELQIEIQAFVNAVSNHQQQP